MYVVMARTPLPKKSEGKSPLRDLVINKSTRDEG